MCEFKKERDEDFKGATCTSVQGSGIYLLNSVLMIMTKRAFRFTVVDIRQWHFTVQSIPLASQKMSLKPKAPSRTTEFDILKLQNEKNGENGKKIVKGKMPSHRVWPSKKGIQGPPKELVLKDIAEAQGNIRETLVIRNQAPWDTFQPVYKCDLAGEFYVVTSRAFPYQLAAVREIHQQGISDEKVLNILRNVRHSNVLEARECFMFGEKIYYLHDDISITVDNIVSCGIPLSESEIGSIIHQV